MLVILEGVDGSGKTTLIEILKSVMKCKVLTGYWDCDECVKAAKSSEIYLSDRSPITDIVYRLCDGGERRNLDLFCLTKILSEKSKVIYCNTDSSYEDAMARGEDNITDKTLHERIRTMYDVIITMFEKFQDVPVYKFNWKTCDTNDVIKFIKEEV